MVEAKGSEDNSTTFAHLSNQFCLECPSKLHNMLTIFKN